MTDRMTAARNALEEAVAHFRQYEREHLAKAETAAKNRDRAAYERGVERAERNHAIAAKCEAAIALLVAQ